MRYYYKHLLPKNELKRLNYLSLAFAVLFAFLIIIPSFLDREFIFYNLIKDGDVVDLLTPFILIPLYWQLFQTSPKYQPSSQETLIFSILAVFWVQGQGMHLAANSIGHLALDLPDTNKIKTLTHFYDEILSHYWWDCGSLGLSTLLIYRHWKYLFVGQNSKLALPISAGFIHGFTYFAGIVESATTSIGVPFAIMATAVLFWGRKNVKQQPILTFFFVTYLVACIFFLGWGLYHGGLPEFSEIGII